MNQIPNEHKVGSSEESLLGMQKIRLQFNIFIMHGYECSKILALMVVRAVR